MLAYVGDGQAKNSEAQRRLIYRQLAWINSLRIQLRKSSRFFDRPAKTTKRRLDNHEAHMRNDWDLEMAPFLSVEEKTALSATRNPAAQLLEKQAQDLAALKRSGQLDIFHQIDLMQINRELYALQGKCERIKNTPFPRQYAEFARWFVRVFVSLVPCGLLSVFEAEVAEATSDWERLWILVPLLVSAALIGWVFITMDAIGDASEDPFERSINDVPMNGLCRTIERDLRQMLGENDLPDAEPIVDNILY